jgi:drug/metabolite transporter (DMT)-like permease
MAPYLFLLAAVLSWVGNYVLAGGIHEQISPIALAFWRWLLACVLLLPFAASRVADQWEMIRKHIGLLTLLGFLSVTAFNTLIYQALQTNTVVNTVLINATTPIVIIFLSRWMFGRPIGIQEIGGMLLSFAGILVILTRADFQNIFDIRLTAGDLWTLLAVLCWSLYSVLLRRLPENMNPTGAMFAMFVTGFILLVPFSGQIFL